MSDSLRIEVEPGVECAATLYRPEGENESLPCVVMGAGGTLTQRDGIPEYAERLSASGIAALTFDYRNWGSLARHFRLGPRLAARLHGAPRHRRPAQRQI